MPTPSVPRSPRILLLDIETFPNVGFCWGRWQQDIIRFTQEKCIATYAATWLESGKVFAKALPDYKGYRAGSYDDSGITKDLHKLLDEADIVVAHNGRSFDVKEIQGRFIYHGLRPPTPFKIIDTKELAKKVARFNSNKLDDLGHLLFSERKIKTDFDLWQGCINGDRKCWAEMVRYNKKDVELLEKVYLRLRPWATSHPNVGLYTGKLGCPKCGSENVVWRGFARTLTQRYRRFQCQGCGGWGRETVRTKCDIKYPVNVI